MSNFAFLSDGFSGLHEKMTRAEQRVFSEPNSAAHYMRMAMEEAMLILYREEHLGSPDPDILHNRIREAFLANAIPSQYAESLSIIRKSCNTGTHYNSRRFRGKDLIISVRYMHAFLQWFAQIYAEKDPGPTQEFDIDFVPKIGAKQSRLAAYKKEVETQMQALRDEKEAMQRQLLAEQAARANSESDMAAYRAKVEADRAEWASRKQHAHMPQAYTEAETRKHIIDIALHEAGWKDLKPHRDLEYPVSHMQVTRDNPRGNGFVDYVLWDDNGLPLAVIEAKKTAVHAEVGRHQAKLYADCLEKEFAQRPLIYYTNGYRTVFWDDTFYSQPRRVYGFHSKDELRWKIQQRDRRLDIRKAQVDESITGRPYQIEAIQRFSESLLIDGANHDLKGAKRSGLLVMATGSGKTRTAASIVDVLMKHSWIRRVLFLADRTVLVSQAKNSFSEHLPNLSSIDLTRDKENNSTRLVFSTYQSIINKIDKEVSDEGRFYGIGHFDLIIVDEAHRSVYNKFGIIFEYFDSLLLGLTATPIKEIDRNTFELFDCSEGIPTFSYELKDAIDKKWLVDYKTIQVSTTFLRDGIKYNDLSDADKNKYEEEFRDDATGLFPSEIRASAFNRWLFNRDTVNKILDALIEKGIKIEGGDRLGRTIIFAANQHHANFILECFEHRYPQFPPGFMEVVHNKVSHAQDIIKRFSNKIEEKLPQIAVSVDMMDTGVDAPRTLNLVFFKVVRSYAKFWQMIGRGTRLCPDIFGPGQDKRYFLIFDACQNFEFFDEEKNRTEVGSTRSVTEQIFITKLSVARLLQETGEPDDRVLSNEFLDKLHGLVEHLDKNRFDVQMKREYVDRFADRDRWNQLDGDSVMAIENHLAKLLVPQTINENARLFDLLMAKFQQATLLMSDQAKRHENKLIGIAEQLELKNSIPQVARSMPLIRRLKDSEFYKGLSQRKLEEIRIEIRELVQYLEQIKKEPSYLDISDSALIMKESDRESKPTFSSALYKRTMEKFIRDNKHFIPIAKLNSNQPLTAADLEVLEQKLFDGGERGTLQQYQEVYGDQPLGLFIRSIVGLTIESAQEEFAEFLRAGDLSANQMRFIDNIIQHLHRNGVIEKQLLFKAPFNDAHEDGLFGLFDDGQATQIIKLVDEINGNALTGA